MKSVDIKKTATSEIAVCDQAGIRTRDPMLKRHVLYLLSYLVYRVSNSIAKVQ